MRKITEDEVIAVLNINGNAGIFLSRRDISTLIAALEHSQLERNNAHSSRDLHAKVNHGLSEQLTATNKKIAELEASQLAVKLPSRLQPGADGPDDWYLHSDPDGEYMKADDVIEAIRAAGITVQEDES